MNLNNRNFWLSVAILCTPMVIIEIAYVIHTYYEYYKSKKK